jgi:hypothetical protein
VRERRAARGPRTDLHNSGWYCRSETIIGSFLCLRKRKLLFYIGDKLNKIRLWMRHAAQLSRE